MLIQRVLGVGASLIFLGYIISVTAVQYGGAAMVAVGLTMLARRQFRGRDSAG